MTPEEFQKWLGDSKIETTIKYLSKANGLYNPKKAWEYIRVGHYDSLVNFVENLLKAINKIPQNEYNEYIIEASR